MPTLMTISNATWSKGFALGAERKDTKHTNAQTERSSLSRQINIVRKEPLVLHLVNHYSGNTSIRQSALKALESLTNPRQGISMHASHPLKK